MKNYKLLLLIGVVTSILLINGCTKDAAPISPSLNTPNFVCAYNIYPKIGFAFYDLNHDENKDKKYFIAELMYQGSDTMKIIDGPFPITKLASNWPSQVKDIGMDNNSYWIVSASMGIKITSGIAQYDSISILDGNPGTLSLFEDPSYARSMAGKTPQGWTLIQVPSGVGGSTPMYPIFYFKEGYYVDKPYSWSAIESAPIASLVPGGAAAKYDWANIDNVISFANDATGNFRTHLFFDFKNWRYFSWEESCAVGCTERKLTLSEYKSLDGLLKWPEGWGKP
ncbi:MAG: hypothetical protein IPL21_14090 [Saprospirales bacterium]|nr:hypothetical protein [Saprospirales bacterium]